MSETDSGAMEQLALDLGLPHEPPQTVISPCNEAAYGLIADTARWPHHVAMVVGGEGTGKSHLANVFAEAEGGRVVPGAALATANPVALAERPIAVDDAAAADERALFHLINAVRAADGRLLLTARTPFAADLPDLGSRLRQVPTVQLGAPDDALLQRVVADAFLGRQLAVDPRVVRFLLLRIERTLHAALKVVEDMDKAGLAERRGPTRHLAAQVLDSA